MRRKSPAASSPPNANSSSAPSSINIKRKTTPPTAGSSSTATPTGSSTPRNTSSNLGGTSNSNNNTHLSATTSSASLATSQKNLRGLSHEQNSLNSTSHGGQGNFLNSSQDPNHHHLESSVSNLNQTTKHHHHHGSGGGHSSSTTRRQAHFVLETIRLKKAAVLSADLGDHRLLRHDNVSNVVSLNKELGHELFSSKNHDDENKSTKDTDSHHSHHSHHDALNATTSSHGGGGAENEFTDESDLLFISQSTTTATSSSLEKSTKKSAEIGKDANNNAFASEFNEVNLASDPLGASLEVQGEVDRFFETGVPLVSTDQVPDADALIVVSAGPDAETSTKMTLSAVEATVKYMAYRSLCVHVSACAIFGDLNDMLGKSKIDEVTGEEVGPTTTIDEHGNTILAVPVDAKVSMFDLLEHGGHRSFKDLKVSEPKEPYFDRYTPKNLQRLGLSNEDVEDKMAQLKILSEDQLRKQYPKALGFMFFIDCIHFRDGFQRFTSEKHVAVHSQHPPSSLFFSRTTVLSSHTPAIICPLVGNLNALPPSALPQSWVTALRHLGSETHHVLHIIASVPEENSLGFNSDNHAETVTDLDEISFDNIGASKQKQEDDKPEYIDAKKKAMLQLKKAFCVSAALKHAVTAGARTPIPEHVFPKRTHLKLPEYVAGLRKSHDEHTNEQKTRHSFAKSALQYLSTQVKGDDVHAVAAMGGLGNDNREKFAAIFRAAFVKNKVMKEQEKRSGSGNRDGGSRSESAFAQSQRLMGRSVNNNGNSNDFINNNNSSGGFSNNNNNRQQQGSNQLSPPNNFNLSNLNLEALLSSVSAGGSGGASSLTSGLETKDVGKIRQQNEALFLIKERLEFDLSKLDKEVKKLRSEVSTSQTKRKRLERELTDAQGRQLSAESAVQKEQTEQNTEVLELRQRLLNMQQRIDALERKNEQLNKNIEDQQAEQERKQLKMQEDYDHKFRDFKTDLDVAIAEKDVLQDSLEEHTGRIHALEELLVQVEVEKKTLNQQLQDSRDSIEAAKAEARKAIDRASRMRKAEREEYLKLLESGKSATEELVTFEDLRVDRVAAVESFYRTGGDGVKSWLKSIGGEQYSAIFHNAGFRDVLSVANITEHDLQALKILAGHRRKILAAVNELKGHLSVAISKRQMAPISHELANFEELVEKQREWYRDFAAVVRAEQANDDDEVFV